MYPLVHELFDKLDVGLFKLVLRRVFVNYIEFFLAGVDIIVFDEAVAELWKFGGLFLIKSIIDIFAV